MTARGCTTVSAAHSAATRTLDVVVFSAHPTGSAEELPGLLDVRSHLRSILWYPRVVVTVTQDTA